MKILLQNNVFEESLNRIRLLFDEFPFVCVNVSGGKDSTVLLNLALRVAKEKNRLPLPVMWIDQEVEWQGTVDWIKNVMYSKDVIPYWLQIPMVITNNASSTERYNHCWNPNDKDIWTHDLDPISIKSNIYGTIRFHEIFEAFLRKTVKGKACYISGVRAEESPKRLTALTDAACYKNITWGRKYKTANQFVFYPIYDWSYTDIWKAINENGWKYNKVYDYMYRHGVPITDMRISNLHHETAIQSLMLIQEIEPKTWDKVSKRINASNSIKHLKKESFTCPNKLPYMFNSWYEYMVYLAENLIYDTKNKNDIIKNYNKYKDVFIDEKPKTVFLKTLINTILSADWDFTKFINFIHRGSTYTYIKYQKGIRDKNMLSDTTYLNKEQLNELLNSIKNERAKK